MEQKQCFESLVNDFMLNANDVLLKKNATYESEEDVFANFTDGANITGMTPEQTAFSYQAKHLASFKNMIMHNDFSDFKDFEEKCTDIVNYVAIIYAMVVMRGKDVVIDEDEGQAEA